jgi:hypothetical protein
MVKGGKTVGYVKPDSALVRAADDLLSRHSAQPGGVCPSCGQLSPCPSARHAVEVRRAAGLPDVPAPGTRPAALGNEAVPGPGRLGGDRDLGTAPPGMAGTGPLGGADGGAFDGAGGGAGGGAFDGSREVAAGAGGGAGGGTFGGSRDASQAASAGPGFGGGNSGFGAGGPGLAADAGQGGLGGSSGGPNKPAKAGAGTNSGSFAIPGHTPVALSKVPASHEDD